ncbi:hypothetical protein [Prevotella sp.]
MKREKAKLDHTSFIDAMIHSTHVMIEQKSLGKENFCWHIAKTTKL